MDEVRLLLIATGVGVLTGAGVVALNLAVREIRDILFAGGLQASTVIWQPLCGGLAVSLGLFLVGGPSGAEGTSLPPLRKLAAAGGAGATASAALAGGGAGVGGRGLLGPEERARRAVLRAGFAAATLGSGNSLGPEGPSVELGANVAAFLGGFGRAAPAPPLLARSDVTLGLLASGCAAGVAAGFNAPIAGLFFAVEVVKPPQSEGSESIVSRLLAAAFAAAVVQIGLGASPAVKGITFADAGGLTYFELPFFMLLGALCGAASGIFTAAKTFAGPLFEELVLAGIPRTLHPIVGSSAVALVTSVAGLPELLYQGFDNVNSILIQASSLAPERLLAFIFGKIFLTAICAASGLVGGVFAPSLFIGAAAGALYGQAMGFLAQLAGLPISPATDYAAVGGAGVLASICGVPLTAVVLLLELTAGTDYTICLPLIAAVGLSVYVDKALLRGATGLALRDVSKDAIQRNAMGSEEEDKQAGLLFDILDKNKDGTVSREEFRAWFVQLGERAREIARLAKGGRK